MIYGNWRQTPEARALYAKLLVGECQVLDLVEEIALSVVAGRAVRVGRAALLRCREWSGEGVGCPEPSLDRMLARGRRLLARQAIRNRIESGAVEVQGGVARLTEKGRVLAAKALDLGLPAEREMRRWR